MAGPNYTVIPNDWQNLEYIISDLCSRIIDEDASFSDYILKDGSRAFTGTGVGFKDEDDMASDSAVAIASQQSIKKYIDDEIAGLFTGALTEGSVLFADASGLIDENNSALFWDDGNERLGIGVSDPDTKLEILSATTQLKLSYDATNYFTFAVQSDGDLTLDSNKASYDLDLGDGNPTTTGLGTFGNLDVDNINLNGSTITHDASAATDFIIKNADSNKDIVFQVNDGGVNKTACSIIGQYLGFEGAGCTVSGDKGFAWGAGRTSGAGACYIGDASIGGNASGDYSAAFGFGCIASEDYSFAAGNSSVASGLYSVALGGGGTASGSTSVCVGPCTASGTRSIAFGFGVTAGSNTDCIAFGRLFTNNTAESFAVGYGAKDFTINATDLTWNGIASLGDGGATNYTQISATGAITQAGSATASFNATTCTSLIVDTTTLVVNAPSYEDRVGMGTATPAARLHLLGTSASTASIYLERHSADAAGPYQDFIKGRAAGASANVNDFIGGPRFRFYNDVPASFTGASISGYVENVTDGTEAAGLVFRTTTAGGALTTRVYIDGAGNSKLGDGGTTNYVGVDVGGRILLYGTAQTWEDLRIVPGAFQFAGSNDPTLQSWQPGGAGAIYKVYKFAKNDEVFFTCQIPHNYKEGSDIKPHMHWTPGDRGDEENGNAVGWKIDYSWANTDAAHAASTTVDLSDSCSGTDDLHELTASGTITGTGKTISSLLVIRLYRSDTGADDTWVGATSALSPALLEFDLHYEVDSLGSDLELTKDAP